jgi:hypothetical protein
MKPYSDRVVITPEAHVGFPTQNQLE